MTKIWTLAIGALVGLALTVTAGWFYLNSSYTYHGALIDPPATAADFRLTDQNGRGFQLSEQRGNIVLIFFGYTHCPDVCPVTLSEYRRIKEMLGDKAQNVRFVYITVDPERDNAGRLKVYLENFDSAFIGLTGDMATLEPVWKNYGVYRKKQDVGSAAGYLMDHSSRMYVIDLQGNWRINYPYGTDTEAIAKDLLHLLKED